MSIAISFHTDPESTKLFLTRFEQQIKSTDERLAKVAKLLKRLSSKVFISSQELSKSQQKFTYELSKATHSPIQFLAPTKPLNSKGTKSVIENQVVSLEQKIQDDILKWKEFEEFRAETDPHKLAKLVVEALFDRIQTYPDNYHAVDLPDGTEYLSEYDKWREGSVRLLAATQLIEQLSNFLESLLSYESSDSIPRPVNFIRNNKLPAPDDDEHKRVRLPLSIAEDLADTLDLMDKEMAQILMISIRTYHRLKPNGLLNPVASERLAMLKELADYGLEVFENQDSFNQWLRLPLQELSDNSPLNSLETITGFNQVKIILSRIDYGVYS